MLDSIDFTALEKIGHFLGWLFLLPFTGFIWLMKKFAQVKETYDGQFSDMQKENASKFHAVQKDIYDLQLLLAQHYYTKTEVRDQFQSIDAKLDRIIDKLESKADK